MPLKRSEAGGESHRLARKCWGMWVVGVSVGRRIQPDGVLIPTGKEKCKYRARDDEESSDLS